jgi:hypothetical protein
VIKALPRPVLTDPVDVFLDGYHGYLTVGLSHCGAISLWNGGWLKGQRGFTCTWPGCSPPNGGGRGSTGGVCASSARQVVSALHCLLRYLRLEGLTGLALDDAVLSVAGWNPSLPRGISPAAVRTPGNQRPPATSAVPRR